MKFSAIVMLIAPCLSSSILVNTDHYGGDLFAIQNVSSAAACSSLCSKIPECNLVTWCPDTCYVKNVKQPASFKANCTSVLPDSVAKVSGAVRVVASSATAIVLAYMLN